MDRMTVSQEDAPCVLHKYHAPKTTVNEFHHPFPQAWQRALYGEIRDDRRVSVCATGHNNVHKAIAEYAKYGAWPDWAVGKTRDLAEEAFSLWEAAKAEVETSLVPAALERGGPWD